MTFYVTSKLLCLQETVSLFQNIQDQFKNITHQEDQSGTIQDQKQKTGLVFNMAAAFERFALNFSKYHLNETMSSKRIVGRKIGE